MSQHNASYIRLRICALHLEEVFEVPCRFSLHVRGIQAKLPYCIPPECRRSTVSGIESHKRGVWKNYGVFGSPRVKLS